MNAVSTNIAVPASFYPKIFAKEAELKADGIRLRASILQRWLATEGYNVADKTVRKLISDVLGHKWGKSGQNNYNYKDTTAYCKHYSWLLKEQAEGRCIIVYWDQSYIVRGHSIGYGWGSENLGNKRGEGCY